MLRLAHVLVLGLALVACSKKTNDVPAVSTGSDPTPTGTKPAGTCTITLNVDGDAVKFSAGATTGSTTATALDLGALKDSARCAATIVATDATGYKTVIAVMDRLISLGIHDVSLDAGTTTTTPMRDSSKVAGTQHLADAPVLILAKDKASVHGPAGVTKDLGASTAPDLDHQVQSALPEHPSDPTVIVQADQELPYAAIRKAIAGAKAAGYDNVLFAVKTQ